MWKHRTLQFLRHVETLECCRYPHYMWKHIASMIRILGFTQTIHELTASMSGALIPLTQINYTNCHSRVRIELTRIVNSHLKLRCHI